MIWLYSRSWFLDFSIFGVNMRELFQVHPINLSVAIWVGFLALFGIASDDGVVMCTYLKQSFLNKTPASAEEIRQLVKNAGLLNVMHSNGFINQAPLENLCTVIDAANIDLKGFTDTFYQDMCSGQLAPVLRSLKTLKAKSIHLKITNLIIPTLNDDPASNRAMFKWIAAQLGPDVPVHLSRFHPTYKIQNLPRTPVSTLEQLHTIAKEEAHARGGIDRPCGAGDACVG